MSSTLPACITGSRSAFLCSQSSCAYSLELCRHCGNSQIGSAAPQSRPASRLKDLLSLEPCTHAVAYMSPTARAPHANASCEHRSGIFWIHVPLRALMFRTYFRKSKNRLPRFALSFYMCVLWVHDNSSQLRAQCESVFRGCV